MPVTSTMPAGSSPARRGAWASRSRDEFGGTDQRVLDTRPAAGSAGRLAQWSEQAPYKGRERVRFPRRLLDWDEGLAPARPPAGTPRAGQVGGSTRFFGGEFSM